MPDEMALVKEIKQVMLAALDMARYYGVEAQLAQSVDESYEKAISEGLIERL